MGMLFRARSGVLLASRILSERRRKADFRVASPPF